MPVTRDTGVPGANINFISKLLYWGVDRTGHGNNNYGTSWLEDKI